MKLVLVIETNSRSYESLVELSRRFVQDSRPQITKAEMHKVMNTSDGVVHLGDRIATFTGNM